MNELVIKENVKVEDMIYEIRGKQVMLDSDLAILYECANSTKTINQAVKRHPNRFPERFMFQLTEGEYNDLRSQVGTANISVSKKSRTLPYAFTEQGVAMLATILRTNVASEVSIKIMDAFVAMRKYISSNLIEQKYINELVLKDNKRIDLLEDTFNHFKSSNNEIYFEGQIYQAYSKIIDILSEAKEEIVLIDSYADKTTLDIISKIQVPITLLTKSKNNLKQIDIDKYNSEYTNLNIIYNDNFHDRYFILDNYIIYHCGASLNYAGSKTFSINKLEDELVINSLIDKVNQLKNKKLLKTDI